ncbi:ArsR/SmtB family transcription factor [Pannonibacter phragmitetus]|uniref:ArsR/SmtB family transcription factor n=1 Tax=Pannonibacter phragmitetus TaxID=121719 RepID=UPI00067DBDF9|nr:metalloregulator ArsR/SmtB family transcription factor [Pannonibacter phragmitetus]
MSSHGAERPGHGSGGGACCAPKEKVCRNADTAALADLFRALGHPVRIGILKEIIQRQEACCGEIVGCLPLAQSTVSQHLQVLKEAGLLACDIRGRTCSYRINEAFLAGGDAAGLRLLANAASFFNDITAAAQTSSRARERQE